MSIYTYVKYNCFTCGVKLPPSTLIYGCCKLHYARVIEAITEKVIYKEAYEKYKIFIASEMGVAWVKRGACKSQILRLITDMHCKANNYKESSR